MWNIIGRKCSVIIPNIVGKYGNPVQRALQKLSALDIRTICSTHGPVWREYAAKAIDIYDRMSRYEGEEGDDDRVRQHVWQYRTDGRSDCRFFGREQG